MVVFNGTQTLLHAAYMCVMTRVEHIMIHDSEFRVKFVDSGVLLPKLTKKGTVA